MATTLQIGKAGELLVQFKLIILGIESAPMTTDTGIDLVAYSPRKKDAFTIQVKSNLKPKPGGGKGKPALDWWIDDNTPANMIALVDLSTMRTWLFRVPEVRQLAQQHSGGRHHLYMHVDPTTRPSKGHALTFTHQFEPYLLENRAHLFF